MKKIFMCAAMVIGTALTMAAAGQTTAPVKDDLFAGTEIFAKGASDVTEVTMDPDTLGMVTGKDGKRATTRFFLRLRGRIARWTIYRVRRGNHARFQCRWSDP